MHHGVWLAARNGEPTDASYPVRSLILAAVLVQRTMG